MNDYNENIRQSILNSRFSIWDTILRDLECTAAPDHSVVRFPNSSTYIFSTCTDSFWMMDPNFNQVNFDEQELNKITALIAEKIRFIVITHLHGDHCQMALVRKLKVSPIRWIVSSRFKDAFIAASGIAPDHITALADGGETLVDTIRIEAQQGYHAEPDKADVVSCSYNITLPDGVRLFFPGDIRDFEAPIPHREQPVDYIFGHVFLGREDAQGNQFSKLESFCRFMSARKSANLILTHLYEVSRLPRDLWTNRHAAMVSEKIGQYDPALKVIVPHFGDMLHLIHNA